MPRYSYKARDEFGRAVKGTDTAEGVNHLAAGLRAKNFYLISASEKKRAGHMSFLPSRKVKRQDLIDFTYHLSTVFAAGIPIIQGLEALALQRRGTRFGQILEDLVVDLKGGSLIHEALSRHPEAFGETYVAMVKAGEQSGRLEYILKEMTSFLEWQEELSSDLKKLTIYPIAVISAVCVLIMFVFTFAFPRIFPILQGMNIDLPLSTRLLMGVSKLFQSYWYVLLTGAFFATVAARLGSRLQKGRMILDRLKLKIPLIGGVLKKIYLSRFARHLSLLLDAGIGIISALTLVEKVVGNEVIAEAIKRVKEQIQAGSSISDALRGRMEFPPMVLRMIAIGEYSGTITDALSKVSSYYDREVPTTMKKLFSTLEPAFIFFLAIVVLLVALSIYMPIYQGIATIGR